MMALTKVKEQFFKFIGRNKEMNRERERERETERERKGEMELEREERVSD